MDILVKGLKEAGSLVLGAESRQLRSGFVVLEKGKEMGEHETGGGEELIVFFKGKAEVSYDRKTETVRAPAVVLVPAHILHSVKNASKTPVHYVYVYNMSMDKFC